MLTQQHASARHATITVLVLLLLTLSMWSNAYAQSCAASSSAKCLYVTPDGDGDGSFSSPGNLQSELPKLSAGDILYLRGGVYSSYYTIYTYEAIINLEKFFSFASPAATADNPITISGYPGETAILRGDYRETDRLDSCILIDKASHLIIQDLQIENCFDHGIYAGIDIPGENLTFRRLRIRNVRFNDNSGFITVHSYRGVVIENSVFYDYVPRPDNGATGYYLKFFQAIDVTVRDNELYGTGGGLYYKHGEATQGAGGYTRIYRNHFHDLTREAIGMNQNRAEIYNNLFEDAYVFFHQEDGTRPQFTLDSELHHNTFIDSAIDLRHGSNDGNYFDGFGLGAKDTDVHHNILVNSGYYIWRYGTNQQYNEGINLQSNDNCFFQSSGEQRFDYFSSTNFGNLGESYTLAGWKSAGYDSRSVEVDPQLDASFRPAVTSMCKNKGHLANADTRKQSTCYPVKTKQSKTVVFCL